MRSGSIAPGGSGLGLSGIEPQGSGHIVPRSAVRDGGAREPPGDSVERVDRGADRRQGRVLEPDGGALDGVRVDVLRRGGSPPPP
jgi:hypothetical protein